MRSRPTERSVRLRGISGMKKAVDLLQQTENEETEADEKLTGIATEMYTSAFGEEEELPRKKKNRSDRRGNINSRGWRRLAAGLNEGV